MAPATAVSSGTSPSFQCHQPSPSEQMRPKAPTSDSTSAIAQPVKKWAYSTCDFQTRRTNSSYSVRKIAILWLIINAKTVISTGSFVRRAACAVSRPYRIGSRTRSISRRFRRRFPSSIYRVSRSRLRRLPFGEWILIPFRRMSRGI